MIAELITRYDKTSGFYRPSDGKGVPHHRYIGENIRMEIPPSFRDHPFDYVKLHAPRIEVSKGCEIGFKVIHSKLHESKKHLTIQYVVYEINRK